MHTNTSNFMKVGNHLTDEHVYLNDKGCRTQQQLEAVQSIINQSDFLHTDINCFRKDKPTESYKNTLPFRYFTKDGYFRAIRITPTGILKDHWCCDKPLFLEEVPLVEQKIQSLIK